MLRLLASTIAVLVCAPALRAQPFGDDDFNGAVDQDDLPGFSAGITGPGGPMPEGGWIHDFDLDVDVDMSDVQAFQSALGSVSAGFERVMGHWSGTGRTTNGPQTRTFELWLAQWGHRVRGVGWYVVDPDDFLSGFPAIRLSGSIHGDVMTLGISGRLDNLCNAPVDAPDKDIITVTRNPANGRLSVASLVEYRPVGCDRVLDSFTVSRADEAFAPGNHRYSGDMGRRGGAPPPNWFFAPIPLFHPRESFSSAGNVVEGFFEFDSGGNWGEMDLQWDPATQTATYHWTCRDQFRYTGVIDGNKFTGIVRFASDSEEEFFGIFSHTLQDDFVPPGALVPCGL